MAGIINPFSNYGKIVSGEHFIGRKNDFQIIEERVIRPDDPGNLAIIGEPRIGKSSLIYHKIIRQKKDLINSKILPVWINVGKHEESSSFFNLLAIQCYSIITSNNLSTDDIDKAAKILLSSGPDSHDRDYYLHRFFEKIHETGIKILIILDEFDHSRILFKRDPCGFQKLRDLCYNPELGVTFVTISRRSLYEIEEKSQAISTLEGIFLPHYLGMYDDNDILEYFEKFQKSNIILNDDDKKIIISFCGRHPYLLAISGYEIFENYRRTQHVDTKKSINKVKNFFEDYYQRLTELLREDKTLNKLLQVLFGPVIDVTPGDVDRMMQQGLIIPNSNGLYNGFSDQFYAYLKLLNREVEFWPIWSQTEKTLRKLIADELEKKYGPMWINDLEKRNPNIKKSFDSCRVTQINEKTNFGARASNNILDYTYPADLFAIIFLEYKPVFEKIFGKDKQLLSIRGNLLAKIRNPLAHNRFECISKSERIIAEGYCMQIISTIQEYERSQII
jgi:hypothetical protein